MSILTNSLDFVCEVRKSYNVVGYIKILYGNQKNTQK
jgi:hypothetical protein